MRNLAGCDNADEHVQLELERARVPVVPATPPIGEVRYRHIGKLGDFTFTRAWCYWMVVGPLPLEAAEELAGDPVGRTDIRVVTGSGLTPTYHIDTEVGLRLFVDTIRAHGLV